MEQSKVMEYESRKASSDVLKPRNIYKQVQNVQLKSGPYFNLSDLFTKINNMLYYTTNLYLQ